MKSTEKESDGVQIDCSGLCGQYKKPPMVYHRRLFLYLKSVIRAFKHSNSASRESDGKYDPYKCNSDGDEI